MTEFDLLIEGFKSGLIEQLGQFFAVVIVMFFLKFSSKKSKKDIVVIKKEEEERNILNVVNVKNIENVKHVTYYVSYDDLNQNIRSVNKDFDFHRKEFRKEFISHDLPRRFDPFQL